MSQQLKIACCCGPIVEPPPTQCPPSCPQCSDAYSLNVLISGTWTHPTFGNYRTTLFGNGIALRSSSGCFFQDDPNILFTQVTQYLGGGFGDAYSGSEQVELAEFTTIIHGCVGGFAGIPIGSRGTIFTSGSPSLVAIWEFEYRACPPNSVNQSWLTDIYIRISSQQFYPLLLEQFSVTFT